MCIRDSTAGGLRSTHSEWLEPIMRSIACGRVASVEKQFYSLVDRWARNDRLVVLGDEGNGDVLGGLCAPDSSMSILGPGGERPAHGPTAASNVVSASRVIVRCGEHACVDDAELCMLES